MKRVEESQEMLTNLEGSRVKLLKIAVNTALAKVLSSCSMDKLSTCFTNLNSTQYEYLDKIFKQLQIFMQQSVEEELEKILKENQAIERLNALDKLIEESKQYATTRRRTHSETPEDLVNKRLYYIKKSYHKKLVEKVEQLQEKHEKIVSTLTVKRNELQSRRSVILEKLSFLNEATNFANELPIDEISEAILQGEMLIANQRL
ncbi:uncharacterized protein LOC135143489 [Zophobas morio]|uniref:uncharacterized protein LOC135143489 n=1 Tax=Zophobas morio TaxID=2755281 RepID=UPI00308383CB